MTGICVLGLWCSPSSAQDLGGLEALVTGSMRGDGPGTLVLLLLKGIDLSPEQKQQVKAIFVAHRDTLETHFRELQTANAALSRLLFAAEEVRVEDVGPQAERVSQLRARLLREGVTIVLQVRQVLTAEQRAKAARLREQLRSLQGALSR